MAPLLALVLLAGLGPAAAQTTGSTTSAEPFWPGKDCVRNDDGGRIMPCRP
jgi:hypothetical protein